jgi:hypothetical protein
VYVTGRAGFGNEDKDNEQDKVVCVGGKCGHFFHASCLKAAFWRRESKFSCIGCNNERLFRFYEDPAAVDETHGVYVVSSAIWNKKNQSGGLGGMVGGGE